MRKTKPVAPDEGVVEGMWAGAKAMAEVGYLPNASSHYCRKAYFVAGGWELWSNGRPVAYQRTREVAVRWVRDGVLP